MVLRTALIGAGAIGKLRAQAVTQAPDFKLTVVADLDVKLAESLAAETSAVATTDVFAAVRRPDVDMVIVSTPPHVHADITLAALEAGKHVLCEKPLANTLEAALRMCETAEARGLQLRTGFNHRYFPSMAKARQMIEHGDIGKIIIAKAYAGHPGGAEFGHEWVHDGRVTGGGSLVDNGIHILDLLRFFIGDVTTATGYKTNLVWDFPDAEDNGFALFRTKDGAVAQLQASWTEWRGYRFWVEVVGTKGYVRASYPPMWLESGLTPEPGIRAKRKIDLFPAFQVRERLYSWSWTIVESFKAELSDFAAAVNGKSAGGATGRDGLRAMQMAHAVYESSRTGGEVDV